MRDRLLAAAAALAGRRPRTVIAVALVLALSSGWLAATRLELNANTDDLISPDRPYMQRYRQFLDEVGDPEHIYLVVAHDRDLPAARAAIDDLARSLRARKDLPVRALHARIEPGEGAALGTRAMSEGELGDFVLPSGVYADLLHDPRPAAVARLARQRLRRLLATGALISEERVKALGAETIFLAEILAAAGGDPDARADLAELLVPEEASYLVSRSGKLLYLKILPEKDYGTLAVIERPLAVIREVIAEVAPHHPEVEIGLTGKPVLQADEMATSDRDMARSTAIAVVLVALLFMFVMGGVVRPALAVITLLIGIAWTFGLTTLVVGQLNLLSVVFTLILVGIGIDFGVHIVSRYREERRRHSPNEARRIALVAVGRGNTTGAITSSLAFFMATLTDFRGLEELGFIAGSGLVLCMLAMTFVLPALLALSDRRSEPLSTTPPLRPTAAGSRSRTARLALLASGFLAVVALVFAPRVGFDDNILDLQADDLESVQWERRIVRDAGAETWFGLESYADLAALDAAADLAKEEASREGSRLGSHRCVLDLIERPTPKRQELRARLRACRAALSQMPESPDADLSPLDGPTLESFARSLADLARRAREDAPRDAELIMARGRALNGIAKELTERRGDERLEAMTEDLAKISAGLRRLVEGDGQKIREALPPAIRDLYATPNGRFLLAMHPRGNVWDSRVMTDYVAAMRRVAPEVTGVPITHYESIRDMRRGFVRAALFALLAVVVVVFLDFRRFLPTLLALVPVGVGGLWLAGAMGAFGLDFNLANFFSVPILIGIGVDNGIHLVHRWRETGSSDLGDTRRGVFLTSMTTAIGFGCLALASHRGLQSLGLVMAIGSLAILAASLLVLPALLRRPH